LAADSSLRAIVGNAGPEVAGATVAAALRGGWRSGTEHGDEPAALLDTLNRFLWAASAGDVRASVTALLLRPNGEVRLSSAGRCGALVAGHRGLLTMADAGSRAAGNLVHAALSVAPERGEVAPPLGGDPESLHILVTACVAAGETLVIFADAASSL